MKVRKLSLYILLVILDFCFGDIFTAQVELESLFELRKSVSEAVEEYLEKEELRLALVREKFFLSTGLLNGVGNQIKKTSPQISLENNEGLPVDVSVEQREDFDVLSNPINAFVAIKGLSTDLTELLEPALDRSNIKAFGNVMEHLISTRKFPDEKDLKGAALALTRLQKTYLLKTEQISQGCLQEDFCTQQLSVDDCFEIGKVSYQERNYDQAISWFEESLRKVRQEDGPRKNENVTNVDLPLPRHSKMSQISPQPPRKIRESEIDSYLSWAKDIKSTLQVGKQFLNELTGIEMDAFIDEVVKAAENQPTQGEAEDTYSTVLQKYDALCRGEGRDMLSHNPALKCRYTTRSNPYFSIGPIKEEQIHISPPLWVFYDVIYDSEIEVIKRLAKPMFKTATVVNSVTGGEQESTTRVSKSAWLIDSDDQAVAKVNKRIKELANLDMKTAEDLQVANYGLGGMYLPHFDFSHTKETVQFLPKEEGNRIATLMFYMSNVRMGGATAFPHLNLAVWPKKGAAVFWYNLKPDGRGDYRTQHGACPVLIGSKWVSNKWIHERGQEFIRPCDLQPNGPLHKQFYT